jgi:dTDP-4-dehydrorhamnose 3,5-epimerase
MNVKATSLPGLLLIEPRVFRDQRGRFMETYNEARYRQLEVPSHFVQDNLSVSSRGVIRGLHYQHPHDQAKLVMAVHGRVFDVAVDIRRGSPTFGHWAGFELSGENGRQLYIPEGFAHGFCVLSETATFLYKCSDLYVPECEGSILWSDPDIGIEWPIAEPLLSEKDQNAPRLHGIYQEKLPCAWGAV